jgi:leucine-rich PPR motif-containing protein
VEWNWRWVPDLRRTAAACPPAGLCARGRFAEARRAWTLARPLGYLLKYNTYQAALSACLRLGDLASAVGVFRDMQRAGVAPNQVTYCQLISALGKQRRRGQRSAQLAHELWQELQASGAPLDGAALRAGMKACVDVGRAGDAERLLRLAEAPGPADVRAYNILLKAHGGAGDAAALQGMLRRMAAAGVRPSRVTYNTLVEAYVQAGELARARACMEEAQAGGVELDAWSYTSLIKGHVQAGRVGAAAEVFASMRAAGVRPTCVTYTTLVEGHVLRGDLDAARQLVVDMAAAGEPPSAVTYNSLLRGYAAAAEGDALREALRLLDDMQSRGVAPAADTFNTLMAAAVGADDAQLAVDLHARMCAAGLREDGLTYTVLIQAHSRLGRVSDAVAAFEALSRDPGAAMDLIAYNAMVDAFARAGDMTAAESMLRTACACAERTGAAPPLEAHGAVVAGYARLKLVQPAVDAVRRFHASGGTPDVQMLDTLVDVCVRTGEFKMAMQAVRAMELLGTEVDKAKYKAMVTGQMARQRAAEAAREAAGGAAPAGGGARGARQREQRERQRKEKNVYMERFKWTVGLPNTYYEDTY